MKNPEKTERGASRAFMALAAVLLLCPPVPAGTAPPAPQVPGVIRPAAVSVGESFALNKLITPNSDRKNDTFIFKCYNPTEALVRGEIYDLRGHKVADMVRITDPVRLGIYTNDFFYYMEWNPNLGGRVPGGIYIYQVTVREEVLKGTVVVIR